MFSSYKYNVQCYCRWTNIILQRWFSSHKMSLGWVLEVLFWRRELQSPQSILKQYYHTVWKVLVARERTIKILIVDFINNMDLALFETRHLFFKHAFKPPAYKWHRHLFRCVYNTKDTHKSNFRTFQNSKDCKVIVHTHNRISKSIVLTIVFYS